MPKSPTVSIIILNYNNKKFLDDCLSSIKKQTYKNYEVVFVDNNSTDDSVECAKNKYPFIKVIRNKGNYGYAKGNNIGINKSRGKYVLILNPDTIMERTWLRELVKIIERDEEVAACQPKILNFHQKHLIDAVSPRIHYTGLAWGDVYKEDRGFNEIKEINYGSGTAVLIKRSVLNKIGLFDEDLFMYHEDVDMGWRMLITGYKILFVPTSIMYHKYSFSRNKMKNYFLERNRHILLLKNYELRTLFLISPMLLLVESAILFYALREGWLLKKLKAYSYIINNFKRIKKKRTVIQAMRKVSDREVTKAFTEIIDAEKINSPVIKQVLNPILSFYWNVIKSHV